jgi:enoyl-CoA hydratase/carnithine racemase
MALITVERCERVVLVRLNRPKVLNALSQDMLDELLDILLPLDVDPKVGCAVITGSPLAFAAGADIKEMAAKSQEQMFNADYFGAWERSDLPSRWTRNDFPATLPACTSRSGSSATRFLSASHKPFATARI